MFAFAIEQLGAQDEIAHRACMWAARAGQTCGNGAAYGGVFAKVWRFKRQHLAFFSQGRFNFQ